MYSELCDIYGDQVSSETPVQNEDLNRMEYMERVIKETLRIFPIGPIIARKLTEDINIGSARMTHLIQYATQRTCKLDVRD